MEPPIEKNAPAAQAGPGRRPHSWWWLATILTAAVASTAAFWQGPRPGPDRSATWPDKLLYPVETNAWLRVPDAHARHPREAFLDVRTAGSGSRAFVATTEGLVYRTVDGGASWKVSQIVEGRPGYRFYAFDAASAWRGWALGEDGALYTSNDGLVSWSWVRGGVLSMAAFAHSDDVALVDDGGLMRWNPDEKAPKRVAALKGYAISIPSEDQPVSLLTLPDDRVVVGRGAEVAVVDLAQDQPLNPISLPGSGAITRLSRCGGEVCARLRDGVQRRWVRVPAISFTPSQKTDLPGWVESSMRPRPRSLRRRLRMCSGCSSA